MALYKFRIIIIIIIIIIIKKYCFSNTKLFIQRTRRRSLTHDIDFVLVDNTAG